MLELCATAVLITLISSATRLILKKMELSYMHEKNEREGKYIN